MKQIIDKDKTIAKILESKFPGDLLYTLVLLDATVRGIEEKAREGDENVTEEQLSELIQHAVTVISCFREEWAVYKEFTSEDVANAPIFFEEEPAEEEPAEEEPAEEEPAEEVEVPK